MSIGRFDSIIADTRKFGFTLATGLLTANALVGGSGHATASTVGAVVVEALVFALYLLDRYYWVLLREAVNRATYLEVNKLPQLHLTRLLSDISQATLADVAALAVYVAFLIAAAALPLLLVGPKFGPIYWTLGFGVLLVIAMVGMYFWSDRVLDEAAKTRAANTKAASASAPSPPKH